MTATSIQTILAPSNLGLRPLRERHVPGTWRAPAALVDAGLGRVVDVASAVSLPVPRYSDEPAAGTRLRNGVEMRRFNLSLAEQVAEVWSEERFSLVIGGDCSILLGCLAGIRRTEPVKLLHIDGHSDFRHPGNYDPDQSLGAVAGMDLALATGRGERTMTEWPGVSAPLVKDGDVVQLGERESQNPDWAWPDVLDTGITVIDVFEARKLGPATVLERIDDVLEPRHDPALWIHLDVDVLDQSFMPAVDTPGSPGLDPAYIETVLRGVMSRYRCCGMTVTIFDPDLDPDGDYAKLVVKLLENAFESWRQSK